MKRVKCGDGMVAPTPITISSVFVVGGGTPLLKNDKIPFRCHSFDLHNSCDYLLITCTRYKSALQIIRFTPIITVLLYFFLLCIVVVVVRKYS